MLSNLLSKSEQKKSVEGPGNGMTDKFHHDELNLLHESCDGDIALHSVELAIQVLVRCDFSFQSRSTVLRFFCEILSLYLGDKSRWQAVLRPSQLFDQGIDLRERFEISGDINDLEKAIAMQRKAIIAVPLNNAERPFMLSSLGTSYRCRYERFGNVEDIDSSITQQFKALACIPRDGTNRHAFHKNLGNCYLRRFERIGETKDIDSAVEQYLKAAASVPLHSGHRPGILCSFGCSYLRRFERFGNVKDLESAIEQLLEADVSAPLDSEERPGIYSSLGNSYFRRFERFGRREDIDSAVEQQLKAVASVPLHSELYPQILENLGNSYQCRFECFDDVHDLESAIKHRLEAVSSIPFNDPERPLLFNNLGISYQYRFTQFRMKEDIDFAIEKHLEAVASTTPDSPNRAAYLNSLGLSYFLKFKSFGEANDINSAIDQHLEAVASSPLDSSQRPGLLRALGAAYRSRFLRFGDVKDIDYAIEKVVEAVDAVPLDSADRPLTLNILGNSYWYRFLNNDEPADLESSISNFRLSSLSLKGLPSARMEGSYRWANLAHRFYSLEYAAEAYDQAFRLLPQVAWIGLNATAQLKELDSEVQTLGCNAAACMIALAEAEHHNRQHYLGRAIELLDQGRSILWSQTSNFKQDLEDLRRVNSDLARDLDVTGNFLAQGCFRDPNDPLSETDSRLYRRYAEKWEELVQRIRGLPGFHHFLLPLPISTLRMAAAEGPVVIINSSKYRCDAVIIPSQGDLVLVPLPDITAEELESLANQQEEFVSRKSKTVWIPSKDYSMPSVTLEQVLNRTWLLIASAKDLFTFYFFFVHLLTS